MIDLKIKTFDDLVTIDNKNLNEIEVLDKAIYPLFDRLNAGKFVGNGTVELINCHMDLDPRQPVLNFFDIKKTNVDIIIPPNAKKFNKK